MTRRRRIALVVLLALLGLASASPSFAQGAARKTVLAIYDGPEDHPSNLALDQAIRAALAAPPEVRVDYFAEYLEGETSTSAAAGQQLRDYLAEKFRGRQIDVVLALTDVALRFVLANRDQLFPDAPIVYVGLAVPDNILRGATRLSTGVLVGVAYAATLKLALTLHPSTERVFVVAKSDEPSRLEAVRQELRDFSQRVQLEYVSSETVPQLLETVKAIPPRSLVLFLWHQPSELNNFIYPDTIARRVAEVSPVPVYGTSDFYTGLGVVGGVVRLTRETGTRVGQMARQLLAGTSPQDIPLERARLVPIFDWRQLRRWGIDESKLPPGADVRFKQPTVWEAYRGYIVATAVVISAQLLMITLLLAQRRSRRRAEDQVRASASALRGSYERIRQLAGRLINAQETARAGIARDLHDDVCQQLAFVSISIGTLRKSTARIQDATAQEAFSDLENRTKGMFDSVRRLSHDLHPASLRLLGLTPALRTFCGEVAARHHVRIEFGSDGDLHGLPLDLAVGLFRIAQEAIRNSVDRGHARNLTVTVSRSADVVELAVSDDGCGFDVEATRRRDGLGLVSMEERARLAGGEFRIASAPGQGTIVRVSCPVHGDSAESVAAG